MGSISVPYPFGFRQGCFHAGFNLTCNELSKPPRLLVDNGAEVFYISLADGTMQIKSMVLYIPLNMTSLELNGSWPAGLMAGGSLTVSERFILIARRNFGTSTHNFSLCSSTTWKTMKFLWSKQSQDLPLIFHLPILFENFLNASINPSCFSQFGFYFTGSDKVAY